MGPPGCFQMSGIIYKWHFDEIFVEIPDSLSKIHGMVIPGSKVVTVLRLLILNAKLVFRIGNLVIGNAWKYAFTMPR